MEFGNFYSLIYDLICEIKSAAITNGLLPPRLTILTPTNVKINEFVLTKNIIICLSNLEWSKEFHEDRDRFILKAKEIFTNHYFEKYGVLPSNEMMDTLNLLTM